MSEEKVLITGANGLLGQKLVNLLLEESDYRVIATSRRESRLPALSFKLIYEVLDITDHQQVEKIIGHYQPDYIVNTAAMTQVDGCEQDQEQCRKINIEGVRNLLQEAEKAGSFFLHISTDFIFKGDAGPYSEDATPDPPNYYGRTKLESEKLVKKTNIPWAIARTVLVYGIVPGMSRSNIILWTKKSLENGETIKVVNDQWRTPTLAEDLARGCLLILNKQATGIYNISGKDLLTPYDMAIKTAEFFELDKNLIQEVDASVFSQPAARPPKTGFILDKARKDLGYDPHSFEEGLGIIKEQLNLL